MYNSKLLNSIIDPHESIPFLRLEKGNNERKFSIEDSSIFELYRSAIFFFTNKKKKKKIIFNSNSRKRYLSGEILSLSRKKHCFSKNEWKH